MRTSITRFFLLVGFGIINLTLIPQKAQAQSFGNFVKIIQKNRQDAEKLLKAYTQPAAKSFGYGLNNSWYRSAAPHKTLGFDLTVAISPVFVPESGLTYDPSELNLSDNIRIESNEGDGILPSFFGKADPNPSEEIVVEGQAQAGPIQTDYDFRFAAPPGLGANLNNKTGISAVPIVQGGIGLPKGIELNARFFPKSKFGDFEIGLWGIGLKHDIWQYVPVANKIPIDVSVFVGYNQLESAYYTGITPDEGSTADNPDEHPDPDYDQQRVAFSTNSLTTQLLVGKTLPTITVYGGLGYNMSGSSMEALGVYPIPTGDNSYHKEKDPIDFDYEDANSVAGTLGARLRFGVLAFHVQYTVQKYDMASAGLGISFR